MKYKATNRKNSPSFPTNLSTFVRLHSSYTTEKEFKERKLNWLTTSSIKIYERTLKIILFYVGYQSFMRFASFFVNLMSQWRIYKILHDLNYFSSKIFKTSLEIHFYSFALLLKFTIDVILSLIVFEGDIFWTLDDLLLHMPVNIYCLVILTITRDVEYLMQHIRWLLS